MLKRYNIHSCYTKTRDGDVVVVKEHEQVDDKITPKLTYFKNVKRTFYVTKPQFRTHNFELEMEDVNRLDRFVSNQFDLQSSIKRALGINYNMPMTQLFSSPYLYGADISLEALIKMKYSNAITDGSSPKITYGFLDIETDTDSDNMCILITYCTHDGKIYTAMLDSYMYITSGNKKVKYTEELVHRTAEQQLSKYYKSHNIQLRTYVAKSPIDMITWIFKAIHHEKVDFIGIWNMNFDIPVIIDNIKRANRRLEDIMVPPEVPGDFRHVRYMYDNFKPAHYTLKWHWLECSGYSQFVDSMCLFSHCRKTQGYRRKYSLDAILGEELDIGKLKLDNAGSHHYMRNNKFLDYTVYNIFDAFSMILLEESNNDILTMFTLSGITPVRNFPRQTAKSTNTFYNTFKQQDKIIGTASKHGKMIEIKSIFQNAGGAVLPPERTSGIGVDLLDRRA